ncbi:unnamed protein product, partial [Pylaiella littoralis]
LPFLHGITSHPAWKTPAIVDQHAVVKAAYLLYKEGGGELNKAQFFERLVRSVIPMKSTLNHDFHEVLGNNTKGAVRKGAENLLKAGEPITSETIFPAARRVFRNQHSKVEEMVGNMVMERTVNPARHCRGTPARSPEDRVPMRTIEVAVPMQAFMMNDLRCNLLAEVETLRNATRANDDGGVDDGEDPVGFRAARVLV